VTQTFGGRRPAGAAGEVAPEGKARILETGYRPYTGPRLGPSHAMWTLGRHTFERIMGLRRPARYKILPVLSVVIAYLPAIAFIGATGLIPSRRLGNFVPDPGGYFPFVTAALVLFATLAAPEALCPDKRSRFLGIYLASPLTRTTYLAAKVAAVATAILLVTMGPPLLLLVGVALQNAGPRGFGAFMDTLSQTILAGLSLSVMFTALALVIPSLTDRRAFASAGGILLILGTAAISSILSFGLRLGDGWLLLGLDRLPFELTQRIFDRRGLPTPSGNPLPTAAVVAAAVGITVVAGAVTWWRVAGAEVTR
jgi:ABC-2 type transport system permease protein